MKRISVIMLAIWLVVLTACSPNASGQPTPTPLPPLVNYEKEMFTVTRGSIVMEKGLLGEVVPSKQDELFFRASGFVNRVVVKQGDVVKEGDILAEMQVDDLLNQLQQARIDLEVAQANLAKEKAQREYDLSKAQAEVIMWEKRFALAMIDVENSFGETQVRAKLNLDITEQNLVLAEQALKVLSEDTNPYQEQAVKRSQLAVERLEKLVSERQITAPYDCQVLRSSARPGTQAEAFSTMFIVGDPTELVVRAPMDYDLTEKLQKTSEVSLRLEADAEESYPVEFLPNFLPVTKKEESGTSLSIGTEYFYFTAPKDLPRDEIPVGRSVFLTVILGKKDDALLLPPAAVREYKGLNFVIVQDGDRRRRVEINEIGLKGEDLWEVESDLQEGDQVLGP